MANIPAMLATACITRDLTRRLAMNETALQKYEEPLTPAEMKQQVQLIQHVMKDVMKDKEHYGTIPGCGDKPTLLKPGAEKLAFVFRMAPFFEIKRDDMQGGHRGYEVICTLKSITSGAVLGQGVGNCSTMESKYRFRKSARKCPLCGEESIIKGKEEYGGGWLCYKAKGGCGEKWPDGAGIIEGQEIGQVEYDNPADYYNTVLKMAKKRAQVDATLTATAASDIFTQDIEEMEFLHKEQVGDSTATGPKDNGNGSFQAQADVQEVFGKHEVKPEPRPGEASEAQKRMIKGICNNIDVSGKDLRELAFATAGEELETLSKAGASKIIKVLEKMEKEINGADKPEQKEVPF